MIGVKRPGTGLEPRFIPRVLGKKTKVDLKKDDLIATWMLTDDGV
jgi:sialic acid synthase SpsE